MNCRKQIWFAVILLCLLLNLNVKAQNRNGCNPNKGNCVISLPERLLKGRSLTGKRIVIIGYGAVNDPPCEGRKIARGFKIKLKRQNANIGNVNVELIDGGYLNEPWVDLIVLDTKQEFPKLEPPVQGPNKNCKE